MKSTHWMLFTVLKKGAVYALVASSMNLLNGFTGLFLWGQSGFTCCWALHLRTPFSPFPADREVVYYLYNGSAVVSPCRSFGGGAVGLVLGVLLALFLGGCVAAAVAWLIGLPVLRLKSDYLAIATLGFAEIIRAIFPVGQTGPRHQQRQRPQRTSPSPLQYRECRAFACACPLSLRFCWRGVIMIVC